MSNEFRPTDLGDDFRPKSLRGYSTSPHSFLNFLDGEPVERSRYVLLKQTLEDFRDLLVDRCVLDFGASSGLSMCALLEVGASRVVGVEPDDKRVCRGIRILRDLGLSERALLLHSAYAPQLPFLDCSFEAVLANAVLEHIPPPRALFICELWRVLVPGGHLIINESPNKYLPVDFHTTGLWFVPWMPRRLARRYAIWRGRFRNDADWAVSGWRGVGYYEITKSLGGRYRLVPEKSRPRHRAIARLGLPPSLLDPYPLLVFQKLE